MNASELVLTDHHQIPNNGAVFVRRTAHMLEELLPLWVRLMSTATWSFNDNGALMEVIARGYTHRYRDMAPCPTRPTARFVPCYAAIFTAEFGPVQRSGSRGQAGLKLVVPTDGFNNHGCPGRVDTTHVGDCASTAARGLMQNRFARNWTMADVYVPPDIRISQGLPPMFGLHAKNANPLPDKIMKQLLHPRNVICAKGEGLPALSHTQRP